MNQQKIKSIYFLTTRIIPYIISLRLNARCIRSRHIISRNVLYQIYDPLPVFTRPKIWYKTLRDIICLERMQRAFKRKLMIYGMMRVVKK
jgi:hypothetical protein